MTTVGLGLGLMLTLAPIAAANPETPAPTASAAAAAVAQSLLDEPLGGRAAIRQLGELLPAAARVNDLSGPELAELLRSDPTARVATDGRLHYVEPAPTDPPAGRLQGSAGAALAPLSETFSLHSNPGAQRTILLDFDGQSVSGSVWNSNYGVSDAVHPGWDPANDGAGFNDGERAAIQQIWSMVSEDYAPYDVDVTTEDRGSAVLERASSADQTYGVRALVSPSANAFTNICQQQCGGVAFVGVFDATGSAYQPAWVFPQALGNSAKAIAEATSHEVGHNLALQHDGTSATGYYSGHGSWAPIMGVGYDRPITQWSKGEYSGANNRQDDLATIGSYLARRADEPTGIAPQTGYITSSADNDVFALGRCSADSTVTIRSPFVTPNLDIRARLRAPDGTVVATFDPASGTTDAVTSFGMDATASVPVAGRYSLDIDGASTGQEIGGVSTGYTTYGSIGAYQVFAPGCDSDLAGLPGSPADLTERSAATESSVSIGWNAPASAGQSAITAYLVSQGNGPVTTVGPDTRSLTISGLSPSSTYDITVVAVNDQGAGVPAAVRLRTAAAPVSVPSAPQDVYGVWNSAQQRPEVYWQPPASDGGAAIDSYGLYVDGAYTGALPSTSRGAYFNGTFSVGEHTVAVVAINSAGAGPAATSTFTVPAADTSGPVTSEFDFTPKSVDVTNGAKQVTVSVRLTDATGAETPTMILDSDTTDQSLGFGSMTRISGNAQDGRYESTVTIPATAATGSWSVRLYPTRDTLGNGGDFFRDHPDKLTVNNAPTDTEGPVTSEFDFTPKSVDVTNGAKQVTVSVRLTDATGAETPTMILDSDTTDQSLGFGSMTRISGNAQDGRYESTVTIPATAATGSWSVRLYPTRDTLGNGGDFFRDHPDKLTITKPQPPVAPQPPTNATATAGDAQATVTWTPPTDNGGAPITSYTVTTTPGGATTTVPAGSTTAVVTGLTNGTAYRFTITATNTAGTSPASTPSNEVTPRAPVTRPGAPTNATATAGDAQATVTWTPPTDNGGAPITSYTVTTTPGGATTTVPGDQRSATITGLTNGTAYRFTITATNTAGTSPASSPSSTVTPSAPPSAPQAPTDVAATPGRGQATVSWKPPSDDPRSPITHYVVTTTEGGATTTVPAGSTTAVVTGLTNGIGYRFIVMAVNAVGGSPASVPSQAVVPVDRPGRVGEPAVKLRGTSATVTWKAPTDNGSPITSFTIKVSGERTRSVAASARKLVVRGLARGKHTATVIATNAVGSSKPSAAHTFKVR